MIGSTFLAGMALVVAGKGELAHDDGKADTKRSTAGNGHAVLFEREDEDFAVTAVRVHGSRYGGQYDPEYALARVSLCDESMEPFAQAFEPYSSWKVGAPDWIDVPIGPVRVPERFYAVVEFFPTQTKGIYLSVDADASGRSFAGKPGTLGGSLADGTWMIRVAGTTKALEVETADPEHCAVLERGEGSSTGKRSTAGEGHAVLFKRGSKEKLLTGVSVFGQRYGGGYSPDETFLHLFVCDRKLRVLARTAFPYSVFPTDDLAWTDLALPPTPVPSDFAVLVYFEPTAKQGVYVGEWSEPKAASLSALPESAGRKLDRGTGWMIRATVCKSAGKSPIASLAEASADDGPDALALAEAREAIDAAERAGDIAKASALADDLARMAPEEAARAGTFSETEHFVIRHSGLPEPALAALERVLEEAHDSLTGRFGFERVSAVPGRKVHVHVTIDEELDTKLFTDPQSDAFSLVVWRGPERALRPPTRGGPHVVYGLCHELGHVLIGWQDSEHKWAHYLGSVVASDVAAALGDEVWVEPYDVDAIEGMGRFAKEIEGAKPGLGDETSIACLFAAIGDEFGQDVFARAFTWIRANREGEPFHAVRLYSVKDDLRDALVEETGEKAKVDRLFGR